MMCFILPVGRYPVQEKAQRINSGTSQVGVILTLFKLIVNLSLQIL